MMQSTPSAAEGHQEHPQQQPWMAMQMQHQYPAAAMMMQHQMQAYQHYPPQPYMAYPQQMQQPFDPSQQQQSQYGEENKTIWIGELQYWMDEGYINSCFGHTGEVNMKNVEAKYQPIWDIIDRRWDSQMHRPLHAAALYLNPGLYYDYEGIETSIEIKDRGLFVCISRLATSQIEEERIFDQLNNFRHAIGAFGMNMAIKKRKEYAPVDWWLTFGIGCPELLSFAIRILGLTCSASPCERNWSTFERVVSVKVIRNKQTGQSEGYGFVEFASRAAAENVLHNYNGTAMPNAEQPFRLNWASFSMGDKRSDVGSDHSIFVGDLASDVTDTVLHDTFLTHYPSVKGAKVVMDANTGRSKGYGFVRFADDNERIHAMTEMNGAYCSSRPMRIGAATPRKSFGFQQQSSSQGQGLQSDVDLQNTTIFVGGLDPSISDEDLRQAFSPYGDIASVKIPVGKGCGFVQFMNRVSAEEALSKLNGIMLGKQTVRLSWGCNPGNKLPRADQANQWGGSYSGAQSYDGYGYTATPHHPAAYAATYGSYPV